MVTNPFPISAYLGPLYFCDREVEVKSLYTTLTSNQSVTLHAIRRIGKTGLIKHFFNFVELNHGEIKTIYVDLFDTQTVEDFTSTLGNAILKQLVDTEATFISKVTKHLANYRPTIGLDTITGNPTVSLDLRSTSEAIQSLDSIMNIVAEHKSAVIIALDEFQQIDTYPKSTLPATIRRYISEIPNLQFIFSGSKSSMLLDMMTNPKHALFRSTALMPLQKIDQSIYKTFIKHHFTQGLRTITSEQIDDILTWTDTHTYFTQAFCNKLYSITQQTVMAEDIKAIKLNILAENEAVYYHYHGLMSRPQWNLLRAIAKEDGISQVTSSKFLSKHSLGAHSTVRRSLDFLLSKEFVYQRNTIDGRPQYHVYDVFLRRWLSR